MNDDKLILCRRSIRATDSNSLLRLYDLASEILHGSSLKLERAKADKTRERIAAELKNRGVHL